MDLFAPAKKENVLPRDGSVRYFGRVFDQAAADALLNELRESTPWSRDEVIMFGRRIITAREVSWHGDEPFTYTYSGITKQAQPWTPVLRKIKTAVETLSGASFNSCLLNLYHDGSEGMSWHSDNEKMLAKHAAIASVSFGAERKFCFKHKRHPESASLILEHGSLLVMAGETQTHWLHALPKSKRVTSPRINLTFRTIVKSARDQSL